MENKLCCGSPATFSRDGNSDCVCVRTTTICYNRDEAASGFNRFDLSQLIPSIWLNPRIWLLVLGHQGRSWKTIRPLSMCCVVFLCRNASSGHISYSGLSDWHQCIQTSVWTRFVFWLFICCLHSGLKVVNEWVKYPCNVWWRSSVTVMISPFTIFSEAKNLTNGSFDSVCASHVPKVVDKFSFLKLRLICEVE